ncbi:unnamed protein product [Ceratitis capitata]|uniref:(Mediterranean fruit fly) hypothetical protein n=1 Tax=Ceratitis capitata TaxID=7213 RepID=A0A811V899_CERCA|nr:unnamed protein product [Ceratitis capitata]
MCVKYLKIDFLSNLRYAKNFAIAGLRPVFKQHSNSSGSSSSSSRPSDPTSVYAHTHMYACIQAELCIAVRFYVPSAVSNANNKKRGANNSSSGRNHIRLLCLLLASVPLRRTFAITYLHAYVCSISVGTQARKNKRSYYFFRFRSQLNIIFQTSFSLFTLKKITKISTPLHLYSLSSNQVNTNDTHVYSHSSSSSHIHTRTHARTHEIHEKHGRRRYKYVLYLLECSIARLNDFQIGVTITSTHVHVHRSTASVNATNACLSVRPSELVYSFSRMLVCSLSSLSRCKMWLSTSGSSSAAVVAVAAAAPTLKPVFIQSGDDNVDKSTKSTGVPAVSAKLKFLRIQILVAALPIGNLYGALWELLRQRSGRAL